MQRPAILLVCTLFCLLAAGLSAGAQESVRLAQPVLHVPDDLAFLEGGIAALLSSQMTAAGRLAPDPSDAAFEIRATLTAFGGTMISDLSLVETLSQKSVLSRRHSTRDPAEVLPEITAFGDAVLVFLRNREQESPDATISPKEASRLPGAGQGFHVQHISLPREGALVAMDMGDLNGDHAMEIVLADRREIRIQDRAMEKDLARFSLPHYEQILRIDTLDTDGDGKAEIWLTAVNPDIQKMRSRVLVLEKGKLRDAAGVENRFFAKGRNENGEPVILSRMRAFRSGLFSGDSTEARLQGEAIVFRKSPHSPASLLESLPVRARNPETLDVLHISEKGLLTLASSAGQPLWESREAYAGLPVFVDYVPDERTKDSPASRFYFPARTLVISGKEGSEQLLLVRNQESSGGLFQKMRIFQTGSLHLLAWNGYAMDVLAASPEFDGYIADLIHMPAEGDRPAQLLFAVVKGGGNLSLSPETRMVTCTLSR